MTTPLMRWVRKTAERLFGKYYEGPDPPERLRALVLDFAERHPRATRAEWVEFAASHAEECYRSGYVRGYEYTERAEERWMPDVDPEEVADAHDPNWRWTPMRDDVADPDDAVPDFFDETSATIEQIEELNRG